MSEQDETASAILARRFLVKQADLAALAKVRAAMNDAFLDGSAWPHYRPRVWYKPWTWFGSRWRALDVGAYRSYLTPAALAALPTLVRPKSK